MADTSAEHQSRFAAIAEALAGEHDVSLGNRGKRGFGSSALQVNGKIFAMVLSNGCLVVKLPKQRVAALTAAGEGQQFDPGHGRLMKEWLALQQGSAEEWLSPAQEALRFVRGKS